ncbi:MAG: type II toxin-antitoxin system RelE/ParE family toxin [Candidatus Harrisonbacteria bacterium]|nr:type II toxin-antitoxin system RelE/ParE family toxin [Candidatus Harrisonbacteria bacterium]
MYEIIILPGVGDYINKLRQKHREKVIDFVRLLREKEGVLDEPYSKHLRGGIRELRINFGNSNHRILYAFLPAKRIMLLLAFLKSTSKTPPKFIDKAMMLYKEYKKLHKIN